MASSACLRPHLPSSSRPLHFKFCSPRLHGRHKTLYFVTTTEKYSAPYNINSILGDRKSNINCNGTPEPARALLERLFAQTQKLEEQMHGSSNQVQAGAESDFNLVNLESDLQAALEALRRREENLQEAETMVMLEHDELNQARAELERREKDIAVACSKQEKLEEELRQANLKLISQTCHIDELKLQVQERNQEIITSKSVLLSKEDEIDKLRHELKMKNAEVEMTEAQLKSRALLLEEANEVVKRQGLEVQELRNTLDKKQEELEESIALKKLEEEKLKIAGSKLEKQTMDWLLAQEELRKLGEEASKYVEESRETIQDFQRVKRLLADVRSELVSSQQSLVTSRKKMEERELLFDKQLQELEEQKDTIMSYMDSLKGAQLEVESEKAKLRVAEARNQELELELCLKKDLIENLHKELHKEKWSLQQATGELSALQEELNIKSREYEEMTNLIKAKEKELVEAKLEIQNLTSEKQSLELVLQERDSELMSARKRLSDANAEVEDLRMLLNSKEDQLIQSTGMLKEKEDYAQAISHELNDIKLKASAAESVVERIVDLTNKLVITTKEGDVDASGLLGGIGPLLGKSAEDYKGQRRQLENELELTRENLRAKETELLGTKRELTIKDEELKMVLQRLEEKDNELKKLREENDLLMLQASQQSTEGGRNTAEDLAIKKLQLEATQLEVEAASSALHKLADMSRELLHTAGLCLDDDDLTVNAVPQSGYDTHPDEVRHYTSPPKEVVPESSVVDNNRYLMMVKSEVARLSALTECLVQEAGACSN